MEEQINIIWYLNIAYIKIDPMYKIHLSEYYIEASRVNEGKVVP